MPFDPYIEQALLNWCTGAASVTRPTGLFIGFQSGSPQYSADSVAPVLRKTATFQAASTGVSASVSLSAALTCTATAACTLFGWGLYASTSGGSRLAYGTITASIASMASGSSVAFTAANLKITLA